MIPRVFHQIWLGPAPLPDELAAYVETWKRHHPGWEHRLWTEDTLPAGLRPEAYQRLRVPAERSDILRLELLRRHGGVYVDTDFECLRPIDPLTRDTDFLVAYYRHGRVNNAIVGATPDHPAIVRALREVRPRATWGTVDKHGTGPLFLDRVVKAENVPILERELFYPEWPERERAFGFHHQARTWKDEAGVRRSVDIARERAERARRELARARAGANGGVPAQLLVGAAHRFADELAEVRRKTNRAVELGSEAVLPRLARMRVRVHAPRGVPVRVPRVMHSIRLGDPGEAEQRRAEVWRSMHPDWEWKEWTEDTVPAGLRPEIYQPLRPPWERADLLALELLQCGGGVVVDPTLTCRRRIDRLVAPLDAFAARTPDGRPSPLLVGAVAGHPAIAAALAAARPTEWYSPRDPGTGAAALAAADLTLLPHACLFPRTTGEHLAAYATDSGGRTHADRIAELRRRLTAAERRQRQLETELARVRGGTATG